MKYIEKNNFLLFLFLYSGMHRESKEILQLLVEFLCCCMNPGRSVLKHAVGF